MTSVLQNYKLAIIAAVAAIVVLMSSVVIVPETHQGVVIFTGLIAYDTQRIKADYVEYAYAEGPEMAGKRSVMDALQLYLNFVNLFQFLLSLMGQRNSN